MTRSNTNWAQWATVLLTASIALLAVTLQWGVLTAKLDNVEKRLDEMIFEFWSLRTEYQAIERRVSFLEGKYKGSE